MCLCALFERASSAGLCSERCRGAGHTRNEFFAVGTCGDSFGVHFLFFCSIRDVFSLEEIDVLLCCRHETECHGVAIIMLQTVVMTVVQLNP